MKSLKINKDKLIDVTFEEKSLMFEKKLEPVKEEYPYGLMICLNNETIKMLGLKELPEVGAKMKMNCLVEVVRTSETESKEGENYTVDLQITDMDLESMKTKVNAEMLYKKQEVELSEAGE